MLFSYLSHMRKDLISIHANVSRQCWRITSMLMYHVHADVFRLNGLNLLHLYFVCASNKGSGSPISSVYGQQNLVKLIIIPVKSIARIHIFHFQRVSKIFLMCYGDMRILKFQVFIGYAWHSFLGIITCWSRAYVAKNVAHLNNVFFCFVKKTT